SRAVLTKEKQKNKKIFHFQNVSPSMEYPNTLDLRRKWAKQ
ncbi:MAG: dehydrogenase, partial [Campylobacterota bacterium]|nr:dehydrogenase [Campylobacterota bacterium]